MRLRGFEKVSQTQWEKDIQTSLFAPMHYYEIRIPERGSANSAGYDFFFTFDTVTLTPKSTILVPTGVKAYMQPNEVLVCLPRSGQGFKYFVRLANTAGVIDSDYYNNPNNEGHIWLKIRNEGEYPMTINKGVGIMQGIFFPYLVADNDDTDSERVGGFGSTDK